MIKINLLPPELRRKKKAALIDRFFIYIFIALIAEIVFLMTINMTQNTRINELETILADTRAEIAKNKNQITLINELTKLKDNIQSRMNALQSLESQRPIWINTLENLASIVPDYLWFRTFAENNDKVDIEGTSYSIKSIATFLVALIKSSYFTNVNLSYIQKGELGGYTIYSFKVDAIMVKTPDMEKGEFYVPKEQAEDKGPTSGMVAKGKEALGLDREEARRAMEGLR
ncbi:PilN domain-containing protein [bacterium]|nr:PilN domain-containing protein [bacterium]